VPTRATYLAATFNGSALSNILSASCRYGWHQNVPEATIFVPTNPFPGSQPYDQPVTLTMGAGNNIVRFQGIFRQYNYTLWPRALGLYFRGRLARAFEYQNHNDPQHLGGMLLQDLIGTPTGTDQAVVRAVLTAAGVSFTSGNIGGTGATWASRSLLNTRAFMWRAGTSEDAIIPMSAAGQTAGDYIQQWDRVSAVYTSSSAPTGFYRTYETPNGIYRALIGGRPRSTAQYTFNEGVDIEPGAQSSRQYPFANAAYVTGFDPGLNIGPVRNMTFDVTTGGNTGSFLGQASNPFQPSSRSVTFDFSSPLIEWGTEAESGIGMNCERVGNALLADLNRETVTVRFRTPRDDYIAPGMVIIVGGPGNQPDRLGMGEPLWVDEVTTGVGEDGSFYQDIAATGGGLSGDYPTPPPPW
jgi:hypothetical protein